MFSLSRRQFEATPFKLTVARSNIDSLWRVEVEIASAIDNLIDHSIHATRSLQMKRSL